MIAGLILILIKEMVNEFHIIGLCIFLCFSIPFLTHLLIQIKYTILPMILRNYKINDSKDKENVVYPMPASTRREDGFIKTAVTNYVFTNRIK
jgi:hypothetical protein